MTRKENSNYLSQNFFQDNANHNGYVSNAAQKHFITFLQLRLFQQVQNNLGPRL